MKTLLRIIGALIVLAVVVILAIMFVPPQLTGADELKADAPSQGKVAEADAGLYATRMADCAACHTAEGGKPFAGGRPIESPFGVIYAPNITPDENTGIGGWTLDQFRGALVDGIDDEGHHLYPAMPYENYRKLSEADIEAMYAYFTKSVKPVDNAVKETSLKFPFNQRWGIRLWNWASLDKPGFHAESDDAKLKRGEYLVEGPGHCAACHSGRSQLFAQAGTEGSDKAFLSGGEIDDWTAPALTGAKSAPQQWSAAELKLYLLSGRNAHAGISGEMRLVVQDSLQYMNDHDADAMVAYLQSLGGGGGKTAPATPAKEEEKPRPATIERLKSASDDTAKMLQDLGPDMPLGARLYVDNCNACHFDDGKGGREIFPALAGNATVNASSSAGLVRTILYGAAMPSTAKRPAKLAMPGFAERLSDKEVAALATFVRSGWGNKGGEVSASDVAAQRKDEAKQTQ